MVIVVPRSWVVWVWKFVSFDFARLKEAPTIFGFGERNMTTGLRQLQNNEPFRHVPLHTVNLRSGKLNINARESMQRTVFPGLERFAMAAAKEVSLGRS